MEERTFTWFPKLTRVLQSLPAEAVAEFALAITAYGTAGTEPEFTTPWLLAVFEGVREDIDNSVNARTKNRGGRPSKKGKEENRRENGGFEVCETSKTPVSQNENQFPKAETPVSKKTEDAKQVSENGNPPYISHTIPSHTNTGHTNPTQSSPDQDNPCHATACHEGGSGGRSDPGGGGDGFPAFLHAALDAWNEATGQTVLAFPERARLGLRQAFDNGRTPDDLKAVLRKTAGVWEPRYVTPNAVFGDKFETWLNRPDCEPMLDGRADEW